MNKKVTIVGAGNSGCAIAADLKQRNFDICLYAHPNHSTKLDAICDKGFLQSTGMINGQWSLDELTTDIERALAYSERVILALPSFAQDEMFELMAQHLQNHHIVINLNGNFSSFVLRNKTSTSMPTILETNSAPHASRADNRGNVSIPGVKKTVPIATLDTAIDPKTQTEMEDLFPCELEWNPDVIAVALQAYNGVLHPAASILNTGWTEATGMGFYFYKNGFSESVGRVIEQIDDERIAIAKLHGHTSLRTTLEALNNMYKNNSETLADFAQSAGVYDTIQAPNTMHNRYLTEDVPFILVPWYELGRAAGYEARIMRTMIDLASTMHGTNYMKTGRTLKKMGLPARPTPSLSSTQPLQFASGM